MHIELNVNHMQTINGIMQIQNNPWMAYLNGIPNLNN